MSSRNSSTTKWAATQNSLAFKQYSRYSDWVLVVEGETDKPFYAHYSKSIDVFYEEEVYENESTKIKNLIDKIENAEPKRTREKIVCIVIEKQKDGCNFFGIMDADYHIIDIDNFSDEMNIDKNELLKLFNTNIKYTEGNSLETMMVRYSGVDNFAQILRDTTHFKEITGTDIQQALEFAFQVGLIRKIGDSLKTNGYLSSIKQIANNLGIEYYNIALLISCNKLQEKHFLDYLSYDKNKKNFKFKIKEYIADLKHKIESQYEQANNIFEKEKRKPGIAETDIYTLIQQELLDKKNQILCDIQNTKNTSFDVKKARDINRGHDIFDFIVSMEYLKNKDSEIEAFINNEKNKLEECIIDEYVKKSYFDNSDIYNWLKEKDEMHKKEFYGKQILNIPENVEYNVIHVYFIPYLLGNEERYSYFLVGTNKNFKKQYISCISFIDKNMLLEKDDFIILISILREKGIKDIGGFQVYDAKEKFCKTLPSQFNCIIYHKCFYELNKKLEFFKYKQYDSNEKFIETIKNQIIEFLSNMNS